MNHNCDDYHCYSERERETEDSSYTGHQKFNS